MSPNQKTADEAHHVSLELILMYADRVCLINLTQPNPTRPDPSALSTSKETLSKKSPLTLSFSRILFLHISCIFMKYSPIMELATNPTKFSLSLSLSFHFSLAESIMEFQNLILPGAFITLKKIPRLQNSNIFLKFLYLNMWILNFIYKFITWSPFKSFRLAS